MDSPGFCAQFCTYTTMEKDTKKIVSIVNKDKRQTGGNSVAMEKITFMETMDSLRTDLKNIQEFCTDANIQISALFSKLFALTICKRKFIVLKGFNHFIYSQTVVFIKTVAFSTVSTSGMGRKILVKELLRYVHRLSFISNLHSVFCNCIYLLYFT